MRKPRTDKMPDTDLSIPLSLSIIGTENDPCFGKHYSLEAKECKRCGDAPLCAITCQTKGITKALKAKQEYLDTQMDELYDPLYYEDHIIAMIKKAGRMEPKRIISRLVKKYDPEKVKPREAFKHILKRVVKESGKIRTVKDEGITYLKLK